MPDGSIQQGSHEQHMLMQSSNQRPQQRLMMINSQQQHQIPMPQQRTMGNMQIPQQSPKQIRMINQPQQISQPQGYYTTALPQRTMAPSPMKVTQQVQVRNEGIRSQMQPGQHMIVRQSSIEGMQLSHPGGVIIQQTSQPSHIVQSGHQYMRSAIGQNPIRARPAFVRPDGGVPRNLRPSEGQGAPFVVRNAYSMPSSSGEQQYQVVQNVVQQTYIQQ
ncbi:hypothetical protein FO519_006136, partial [Halicephalobus sp. NKZ332]